MATQTFPPTAAGQAAANAVSDPKNVLFVNGVFVVLTGVDYVPPRIPTADEVDRTTARAYPKLASLMTMTPAQVQSWVAANVTTLAQAQDAIATLGICVAILARGL